MTEAHSRIAGISKKRYQNKRVIIKDITEDNFCNMNTGSSDKNGNHILDKIDKHLTCAIFF